MLCLCADARQFAFAYPPQDYRGQDMLVLVAGPVKQGVELARGWFEAVDPLPPTSVRLDGRVLQPVTVLQGHHLHL